MNATHRLAGLFAGLILSTSAFAQLPPGRDGYAFPLGGPAGTTVRVQLGGSDWTPDVQFFVRDSRVQLRATSKPSEILIPEPPYWIGQKSYLNDPRLPRELSAEFAIPANLPPGPIAWSVANANGAGSGGLFFVSSGQEILEEESRSRRGEQELPTLPVTVNGRLRKIEEVDCYRFVARQTDIVTCELMARQLGIDLLGVLELRDATGKKILDAVGTDGHDPTLAFLAEQGQTYTICVRDVDFRGYRNYCYRLSLAQGTRVRMTMPAAGKRGEKRSVEFVGLGIATGKAELESVTREVEFPNDPKRDSFNFKLKTEVGRSLEVAFALSDLPEQVETRTLSVPSAVTSRIRTRGERHTYTVSGKKGDLWNLDVSDRRLGSSLDVGLTLFGPDGKPLPMKPEANETSDLRVPFVVPADGEYRIVAADRSGRTPGLDSVYRLAIRKQTPDFRLQTDGISNLPIGGKAAITVNIVREGGFKEPVRLTLAGLPPGITAPNEIVIPANVPAFAIPLECAKTAPALAAFIEIVGTAKIEGTDVKRIVRGTTLTLPPDAHTVPNILLATTMKPPFRAKVAEADGGRRIPRGSTHPSEILIERNEGFTGEIVLDMAGNQQRHRQGIRGPALTVPVGAKKIDYPVFLPEILETTRTSRIGLNAMAHVPDPQGQLRYVLAPVEGQITMSIEGALMKLSCVSDELRAVNGESFELPLKLARAPEITEATNVELLVPPDLKGLLAAKSFLWPTGTSEMKFRIESKADGRLVGVHSFTIRATASKGGLPVVSETTIEVQFANGKQ